MTKTYVPSKFGRQPFYDLVLRDGRNAATTGRLLGFNSAYVQRVAHGRIAPTQALREAMSELLGRPVEELFTASAIAADYVERRNARGERRLDVGDAR